MFVNLQLMLWSNGRITHTLSVPKTFIENWQFSQDSKKVIVRSRWHRGASAYRMFDVATGKQLAVYRPWEDGDTMPSWAQPVSDSN
jgi:hypothetical protein